MSGAGENDRPFRSVEPDKTAAQPVEAEAPEAWRDPTRNDSLGVVIIAALFVVLLSAALMVGGHRVIAPMLRTAIAPASPHSKGEVVYTMPDGKYCRHVTFDNVTGEVHEGSIAPCHPESTGNRLMTAAKYGWGSH